MCLIVNEHCHKETINRNGIEIPKPLKADTNLKVKKMLVYLGFGDGGNYITPFQNKLICFNEDGICYLESDLKKKKKFPFNFKYNCATITNGIHSYTCSVKNFCHYAIIPKGAKYYVGCNSDVVSDRLLIFENQDKFRLWEVKNNIDYRILY